MSCINPNSKAFKDILSREPNVLLAELEYDNIFNNATDYQNLTEDTMENYIASEKTIRDLAARLSDRIGIPVKFESDRTKQYKGKLDKGTVDEYGYNHEQTVAVINLAYATLDTPIHEILGHPIIRAIKNQIKDKQFYLSDGTPSSFGIYDKNGKEVRKNVNDNTELTQLYQNLLKELETGKGAEVLDRIKRDYAYKSAIDFDTTEIKDEEPTSTKEYSKVLEYAKKEGFFNEDPFSIGDFTQEKTFSIDGETYQTVVYKDGSSSISKLPKYTLEEQQEEAIVELLGLMTAEKLDNVKDGKLISLLKRLLKEMKAFMKQLLGQKEVEIDKLPDNMTINDLSDLLAYSNSKLLLPGYEVEYTTPDNNKFKTYQEASNHISDLAKNVKDVDLDNVKLKKEESKKINSLKQDISELEKELDEKNNSTLPKDLDFLDTNNEFLEIIYKKEGDKWFKYVEGDKEKEISSKEILELYKNMRYGQDSHDNISLETRINELKKQLNNLLIEENNTNVSSFIEKNKEYEQSKEIIEEWKKVNNIKYNPEEIYSRGQEFSSVVGAYSEFDVNLMMQNLLSHIEDNKKAGGKFAISAYTKPVDKQIGHLEGGGGKIKFKLYPQSNDILWAANTDVYSGSVWDASEKVNKDKKSELLGVSYTKYPSLSNANTVQPNLAAIVDDLAHHHNELGISLTGNNFRLEYDEDIPYTTKKIIDSINSILDQKYGKLVKPEINVKNREGFKVYFTDAYGNSAFSNPNFNTREEAQSFIDEKKDTNISFKIVPNKGIQATQTNETLKESIEGVWDNYNKTKRYKDSGKIGWRVTNSKGESTDIFTDKTKAENQLKLREDELEEGWFLEKVNIPEEKEYTEQALTNTKIAKLKEVAKKYPRSLIRSEVKFIGNSNNYHPDFNPNDDFVGDPDFDLGFEPDELPFQKVPQSELQEADNTVKEGVKDVFNNTPELSKIGTQEQYSEYLDTIFPDSKVKDIVYHGTNRKFDKFESDFNYYFSSNLEIAKGYSTKFAENPKPNVKSVILNIKTPHIVNGNNSDWFKIQLDNKTTRSIGNIVRDGIENNNDGVVINNVKDGLDKTDIISNINVVFEPEQIHILGSKKDVDSFKEFINSNLDNSDNNSTFVDSENKEIYNDVSDFMSFNDIFNLEDIQIDNIEYKDDSNQPLC